MWGKTHPQNSLIWFSTSILGTWNSWWINALQIWYSLSLPTQPATVSPQESLVRPMVFHIACVGILRSQKFGWKPEFQQSYNPEDEHRTWKWWVFFWNVWKMIFLFQWCILRWTMLIFRGVQHNPRAHSIANSPRSIWIPKGIACKRWIGACSVCWNSLRTIFWRGFG